MPIHAPPPTRGVRWHETRDRNMTMKREEFDGVIAEICREIGVAPLDRDLEDRLNAQLGPSSETFAKMQTLCERAIGDGWMCANGEPPRRWGRVVEPSPWTNGLSVDVVALDDVSGPHHRHPNGEICAVMPLDAEATFDGRGRGWCVYPAGSAHWPIVRGGRALVLYLLPDGQIEFTDRQPPKQQ